ncbi:DUF3783 domain-containing protein [Tannockella kyphosi]|uniref:DUF3783 domain-containing protein n=1 Tax=Tannockella kyphosi TaxID=2899121 RepID=UPI002013A88C|nr:DUF3783 domain-containing protein [Tannockella kyphosi]
MKETVLLLNLKDSAHGKAIETILTQFQIDVVHVNKEAVLQQIGYLLKEPGFEPSSKRVDKEIVEEEMIVFYELADEQLELVLEVFKNAHIPFIPLKAIVTPTNIEWTFHKLYEAIKEEYETMSRIKQGA